ncbi:carbohydrate kinase family protein [Pseudoduganella lutea]|uniref:Carbohydrate kinase n=1 Tax=Pseudoduganella lutea TaxID=321985 RepID=A0A4P6KT65_9BURK|nr:carbohydrate kinase [Pseudoduganella lutea]QBE61917.1 carbohydrate kinase [Pseudoduganella lutea]
MPASNYPAFVAVGEALTDLIVDNAAGTRWHAVTGGSTWNVARVMATLGAPAAFAGAISRDIFGRALWQASEQAGLDLRFIQRNDRDPLLAVVHQTHPPDYFFVGGDSADLGFDAQAMPPGWMDAVRWVHFGGISLARQPLAARLVALAESLRSRGVRISYDPNYRKVMTPAYDATLRRMAAVADVIKVSDEDLAGLFRTSDLDAALATLRSWNPQATVLYTRGAQGASLHVGAEEWCTGVPPVTVVDTVGAGDACIAGLVYSMLYRDEPGPLGHLRFAVATGAAACCTAGAAPPPLHVVFGLL